MSSILVKELIFDLLDDVIALNPPKIPDNPFTDETNIDDESTYLDNPELSDSLGNAKESLN